VEDVGNLLTGSRLRPMLKNPRNTLPTVSPSSCGGKIQTAPTARSAGTTAIRLMMANSILQRQIEDFYSILSFELSRKKIAHMSVV